MCPWHSIDASVERRRNDDSTEAIASAWPNENPAALLRSALRQVARSEHLEGVSDQVGRSISSFFRRELIAPRFLSCSLAI